MDSTKLGREDLDLIIIRVFIAERRNKKKSAARLDPCYFCYNCKIRRLMAERTKQTYVNSSICCCAKYTV